MTPKEKAEALVERFRMNVVDWEGCSINGHKAKQCALIAVDEIQKLPNIGYNHSQDESQYDYWQEVKEEIKNL